MRSVLNTVLYTRVLKELGTVWDGKKFESYSLKIPESRFNLKKKITIRIVY